MQLKVWVIFSIAFLTITGCRSSNEAQVEQTTEQTYEIDPGSALSIRNADGSICIRGSTDSKMTVKARKKADDTERLADIQVSLSPQIAAIETKYSPRKKTDFSGRPSSVDYTVTVPRTMKIFRIDLGNGEVSVDGMDGDIATASAVNGKMMLRNCFGNVRATIANGPLDISYNQWESRSFSLAAQILNGNARVIIPRGASAHLSARSLQGNVVNEFAPQDDGAPARSTKADFLVGEGVRANFEIQATLGDVSIVRGTTLAGMGDPTVQIFTAK